MEISNFILTVFAGIVGTIGMTLVRYAYAGISGKNTKVIHILGFMVTGLIGLVSGILAVFV